MEAIRRLTGAAVADERPLAGRLVGWMFAAGAVLSTLLPLLPGAEGEVLTPTFPLVIIGLIWGLHAALRKDWRATSGWVFHAATIAGVLCIAAAVHDTGGVSSPARFLLLLAIVYSAYFFPAREAWPYFPLTLIIHALPFAYDPDALANSLLGELLILVPCYWLLTFLLISGKRGMIELRAQADAQARQDPLTGIANRRALVEAIQSQHGDVGLLVLDVDDFKRINTLYGHPGGDRALVFVAEALRASSRAVDVPARLGGDEFALLAPGIDAAGMAALAERLMREIRFGELVRISAGWVIGPANPDQLLLEADEALRAAKREGKNRALAYS
ncbi:GGDEF domain-containing protein [Solirubrobacter sp. CPCC 204708]|uniref:GGDEF domain-containing protein n=1 Tax=Solirubrobacter deserti TaxID=2282478 RepID=A0ABT4RFS5_9ACTN|nr:GGDEF domain-containing protein [Solirubrobacter deserti]MBE2318060.1 GGDEF domain-containing protein [Solirubrobacter deserti]MDA0137338.1 GGDEF domain-containing protein [Solirubrobacter deserti]